MPGAHDNRGDLHQGEIAELRQDVLPEQPGVELPGPDLQVRTASQPLLGIEGERPPALLGVDPVAAGEVGLDGGEPALRRGLGGVGDGCGYVPAVGRGVAGLPAPRGQLADPSETTSPPSPTSSGQLPARTTGEAQRMNPPLRRRDGSVDGQRTGSKVVRNTVSPSAGIRRHVPIRTEGRSPERISS